MNPTTASEKSPSYVAVYVQSPTGSWTGEVAALDVSASGVTLDDARVALEKVTVAAVQAHEPVSLPAGVPSGTVTVADRIEVTVFPMANGAKELVTATSRPCPVSVRGPYIDKYGVPLLLDSVVLVIDELGSTSWMTNDLRVEDLVERTELLRRTREWLGEGRTDELESVVVYTDNLVHGAPFSGLDEATSRLGFTLVAASHYQFELALAGTILRGGIAIGKHHQSDSMVAGPALIEAHRLEGTVADVPRVVLSADSVEVVRAGLREWADPARSPYAAQIYLDQDGEFFVSYLNASEEYDNGVADQLLVLGKHREVVVAGIKATRRRSRPRLKWEWLAAYHDHYVRSQGLPRRLRVRRLRSWRRNLVSLQEVVASA